MLPKLAVCVDASFLVCLIAEEAAAPQAEECLRRWYKDNAYLCAPSLIVYEVSHVLYRQRVPDEHITTLLDRLDKLGINLHQAHELIAPALSAARSYDLRAMYDAFYLGLANLLRSRYTQVEFWTLDKKLKNKVNEDWVKLLSLEGQVF